MAKLPTTDDRWMLRGVGKDIRKAVKERAAAEGVSIGKWVKKALRLALDQPAEGAQASDLEERLSRLEARMRRMEAALDADAPDGDPSGRRRRKSRHADETSATGAGTEAMA